ncbi:hypothetical protein F5984_01230 [Rudanella paleaurantiibacter]|uniref:Uncharacterized protein n=1 Tax=Rudanella paleaurantiibacter TaxID=2614655 RepID=A0A7J5U437_9BACT|nr:hypothetical protein [Rudanella paleaurantiibacter]KAB7732609.1 hypothetical protein F5984_01230 [Rudanella paleaurantiibacter]
MTQPWIKSPRFDGLFILLPPFAALAVVLLLPERFRSTDEMPVIAWVSLVLLIDVAHVYSTLFRTYFDPARFRPRRTLFLTIPVLCYTVGVGLYSLDAGWFWRVLAYLAVFHFVRQQYGFLRLYSRTENAPRPYRQLDTVVIYAATLYPLLWWHLTPGRHFNWFVDGDFWQTASPQTGIRTVLTALYIGLLLLYAAKEVRLYQTRQWVNWPRNLLVAGTALSWYAGIVLFNGDVAFTMLNVVAHGIPYIALIWVTSRPSRGVWASLLRSYGIVFFLGVLVVLAYLEEGLWDGLVWREHPSVFGMFGQLPPVQTDTWLAWLVPLLSLPQSTHYVLDGFIWRNRPEG